MKWFIMLGVMMLMGCSSITESKLRLTAKPATIKLYTNKEDVQEAISQGSVSLTFSCKF